MEAEGEMLLLTSSINWTSELLNFFGSLGGWPFPSELSSWPNLIQSIDMSAHPPPPRLYLKVNPCPLSTAHSSYRISSDLWSASSVVITRLPCLSMTPILIDTILWWCIACPFKGYCQQMLGINTVLICHKPQEKHGKQASMKALWTGQRENSKRCTVSPAWFS